MFARLFMFAFIVFIAQPAFASQSAFGPMFSHERAYEEMIPPREVR